MDANSLAKIKELVGGAQNVLIATHEHPTADSIGSSLSLMLGLVSIGKKVTVACPDPVTVSLSSFVGVDKIQTSIEKKNFIISLDYEDGSIEKVSYNIEGDKFNLVIEPRPGFESLTQDKVHYSYAGATADIIFTVDTIHLGGLKKLYEGDKDLYANKPVINVDRHPNNSQYGTVNVLDSGISSTSELVARILSYLGVRLTEDIATNILNAIIGATNNFQIPSVGAGAFELAAACMKAGGRRFSQGETDTSDKVQSQAAQQTSQQPAQNPRVPQSVQPQPVVTQQTQSQGNPQTAPQTSGSSQQPQPPKETSTQAPADWLKPKIFKSSNLS